MVIAWAVLTETREKKSEYQYLRKVVTDYSRVVIEVKAAIKTKYEISSIKECIVVLLKYDTNKKILYALYVVGTKEEITQLQLDLKMK